MKLARVWQLKDSDAHEQLGEKLLTDVVGLDNQEQYTPLFLSLIGQLIPSTTLLLSVVEYQLLTSILVYRNWRMETWVLYWLWYHNDDVSTMKHDINWRLLLLYGRRVIDSCVAVLFAEQSTLSSNHSVALSYVWQHSWICQSWADIVVELFFVLLCVYDPRRPDWYCDNASQCRLVVPWRRLYVYSIQSRTLPIIASSIKHKSAYDASRHKGFVQH